MKLDAVREDDVQRQFESSSKITATETSAAVRRENSTRNMADDSSLPLTSMKEDLKLSQLVLESNRWKSLNDRHNITFQLQRYGFAVLDNFLGSETGDALLQEVKCLYNSGLFTDGQVVNGSVPSQMIRRDKVLHVTGNEALCQQIGNFVSSLEKFLHTAAIIPSNPQLGNYCLKKRTKAMVACYPGNGTYYRKHYDNPNGDKRRLTCVYYLNKDWDANAFGGVLRIFPRDHKNLVANVAPYFDRLVLFWSDRRNPHEVLPAYKERFAITVWYCE